MSVSSHRIFIDNVGPDHEKAKLALKKAINICKNNSWELTLVTPTISDFSSTIYGKLLTHRNSDETKSYDGVRITLNIPRNIMSTMPYDMLFGAHLSLDDMEHIDTAKAKTIFYIPFMQGDGQAWVNRWNPEIIGGINIRPSSTPMNPNVLEALKRITGFINMSTGLTNQYDKKYAESEIKELAKNGHTESPQVIKDWLLQNDWSPRHADQLIKIVNKYFKKIH